MSPIDTRNGEAKSPSHDTIVGAADAVINPPASASWLSPHNRPISLDEYRAHKAAQVALRACSEPDVW